MDKKMLPEWLSGVALETFQVVQKTVDTATAMKITLDLHYYFERQNVYFPKFDNLTRQARDSIIRNSYRNGAQIRALAREYGLTESYIREIVKRRD